MLAFLWFTVYIYVYMYIYVYICIYMYIYICKPVIYVEVVPRSLQYSLLHWKTFEQHTILNNQQHQNHMKIHQHFCGKNMCASENRVSLNPSLQSSASLFQWPFWRYTPFYTHSTVIHWWKFLWGQNPHMPLYIHIYLYIYIYIYIWCSLPGPPPSHAMGMGIQELCSPPPPVGG